MSQLQPYDLEYTIVTDYGTLLLGDKDIARNEVTAPEKWMENMVKWIRNETYWGMFRSLSVPLKFATKAKELLDYVYAMQGSEGNATVIINRNDRDHWQLIKYFDGKVDFSQSKSTHNYFEAVVIEGGVSQKIKTNEKTKYDLNITPFNTEFVWIHVYPNYVIPVDNHANFELLECISFRSALKALMYQMCGYIIPIYSPLLDALDAANSTLYITNGRTIRNGKANMQNFTVTLYDMFQFLNSVFCCGMGIETIDGDDTLVIAERSYFLQDTLILETIPNTREVEISPAKQFLADSIKYGSASWGGVTYPFMGNTAYQVNYFNSGMINKPMEANLPTKLIKNAIDASTDYFTEYHYMIKMQAYNANIPTTEEDGDNDIFVLHCKNDFVSLPDIHGVFHPVYELWHGNTTEWADTMNTFLSPQRSLNRWIPYINSITSGILNILPYPVEIDIIVPSGINLQTTVHSDYSNDDSIEPISVTMSAGGELFKPYIFKIKTSGTVDIADIFEANHNGYIQFYYKGILIKGHIMEVSANPSRRKELEFTLLAHKDTDLTELLKLPVI